MKANIGGEDVNLIQATSVAVVWTKEQVVSIYANARYDNPEDLKWTRDICRTAAAQLTGKIDAKQIEAEPPAVSPDAASEGLSQTEMTLEAVKDYESLEIEHQKIYDEILAIYSEDKEFVDYLRRAQRAWIAFRDAYVRSIWPAIESESRPLGTAERMCIPIELEILTRQRIQQLLRWRKGIEEGDVGAGSRMTPEAVQARERQLKIKMR
jgi:uncharacterized protein YecT (DUF1311 family)